MTEPQRFELQPVWFQMPKFFANSVQQYPWDTHLVAGTVLDSGDTEMNGIVTALQELLPEISTHPCKCQSRDVSTYERGA